MSEHAKGYNLSCSATWIFCCAGAGRKLISSVQNKERTAQAEVFWKRRSQRSYLTGFLGHHIVCNAALRTFMPDKKGKKKNIHFVIALNNCTCDLCHHIFAAPGVIMVHCRTDSPCVKCKNLSRRGKKGSET